MGIVSIFLLILVISSAILLVVLVLLQHENSEGLGGIFGGGGAAQIGNRSGNILTRITSVLGALFLFSSFGLAWLNRSPESDAVEEAARRLEENQAVEWWLVDDAEEEEEEEAPAIEATETAPEPEGAIEVE